jgi:hypothetical protein
MKKTLLLMTFVLGASYSALASPCAMDPLAVYDATGFSCTIGDITFSDFQYTPTSTGGAVVPTDAGVEVTPTTTMGGDSGFEFAAGWSAGPGSAIDSLIQYTATCNGCDFTDLSLIIAGAGATGNSFVNVAETTPTPAESLEAGVAGGGSPVLSDSVTFGPVATLQLSKDVHVNGGSTGFGAQVSEVTNLFSQGSTVPEPSSLILCTGLLCLLPIARRKFGV